jgi:hypothetical protein
MCAGDENPRGVKRDTITLASAQEQACVPSPVRAPAVDDERVRTVTVLLVDESSALWPGFRA